MFFLIPYRNDREISLFPASLPNVTMIESMETVEAPPRVCRLCGNVLEPHESSCIMCSRRAPKEKDDPDIIVVSGFPFAIIDRNF